MRLLYLFQFLNIVFFTLTSHADKVVLLTDPLEAASARYHAIINAKTEITVSTYILGSDKTSMIALRLLKEAAQRGVKVTLIVDNYANNASRKVLGALARAGVHIELYNVDVLSDKHTFLERMHDKLLMVDRKILIMGDRNIAAEYYGYEDDLKKSSKGETPRVKTRGLSCTALVFWSA